MNDLLEIFSDDELRGLVWHGIAWSLFLIVSSTFLSSLVAILLAPCRGSGHRWLRLFVRLVMTPFRNIPTLFWLIAFYCALPEAGGVFEVIGTWQWYAVLAAVLGLSFSNAAYMIEILSGGLQAVPVGCPAMAKALGHSRQQIYWHIILPMAVLAVGPSLIARLVHNAKNSSLVMIIGVTDITWASQQIESMTFRFVGATGLATLFYVIVCGGLYWLADVVEVKYAALIGSTSHEAPS